MSLNQLRYSNLVLAKSALEDMYADKSEDYRMTMLQRLEPYVRSGVPVDYVLKHRSKPNEVMVREVMFNTDGTFGHRDRNLAQDVLSRFWKNRSFILEKGVSLIFYGPNANGKTHFATRILMVFLQERPSLSAFFVRIKDLYAEYVKSQRGEDNFFKDYLRCKMLVIDELGKEVPKDNFIEFLENVLKTRSDNNLNTIICSNLNFTPKLKQGSSRPVVSNEFIDRYGMSCWSALVEKYSMFRFSGRTNQRLMNRVEW